MVFKSPYRLKPFWLHGSMIPACSALVQERVEDKNLTLQLPKVLPCLQCTLNIDQDAALGLLLPVPKGWPTCHAGEIAPLVVPQVAPSEPLSSSSLPQPCLAESWKPLLLPMWDTRLREQCLTGSASSVREEAFSQPATWVMEQSSGKGYNEQKLNKLPLQTLGLTPF